MTPDPLGCSNKWFWLKFGATQAFPQRNGPKIPQTTEKLYIFAANSPKPRIGRVLLGLCG